MTEFLTAIGTTLTAILGWFSTVATALLANEIFQIMFAMIIAILFIYLTIKLAKKVRK